MKAEEKKMTAAERIAAEIEAGREAKITDNIENTITEDTPEDIIHMDGRGEIQYLDLDDVDFDPKWNIRDTSLSEDRVRRKISDLQSDGYIRTPLVVCEMEGAPADAKKRGAAGFLRYAALRWFQKNEPEFFEQKFKGKIPFKVVANATERQRELLMYDHGLEEELDEFEVYLAQKRLMRTGMYTQKAIIDLLAKMYYKLASADDRRRYNERLKELADNGICIIGSTRAKTVKEIRLLTYRGRYQYFQRIAEADQVVEDHFKRQSRGEKVAKITFKAAEELHKMKRDEALQYLETIGGKQQTGQATARTWGQAKMQQARAVIKSQYYGAQLDAALGDESAALSLPDLEDELLKIEKAKAFDPKRFWDLVNTLNQEAEAATPATEE